MLSPTGQSFYFSHTLQWRRNEHHGISNHRHLDSLLNHLFRLRSKKTSKLCVTGLCEGNPPVIGGFPSQRASYAENVSIWWYEFMTAAMETAAGDCRAIHITVTSHEHRRVWDHRWFNCVFNSLFRLTSKKTPKLYITGPLGGELTAAQWFSSQRANSVQSISMSWCHHEMNWKGHLLDNKFIPNKIFTSHIAFKMKCFVLTYFIKCSLSVIILWLYTIYDIWLFLYIIYM